MTFDALLKSAAQRLQRAGSPSPRIDAEVLMTFAASRSRTWLYTWGDSECPTWEHARFDALVAARAQGQPVAYLTGEREFWGAVVGNLALYADPPSRYRNASGRRAGACQSAQRQAARFGDGHRGYRAGLCQ